MTYMRVRDKKTGKIIEVPITGVSGKSAYQYAQEAGYTGTEEEFAAKLASESDDIYYGADAEMPEGYTLQLYYDPDDESTGGGGAWRIRLSNSC